MSKRSVRYPGPAAEQITRIQNEQICERLLKWIMVAPATAHDPAVWHKTRYTGIPMGGLSTPAFDNIRDCAYIIERLLCMGYKVSMGIEADGRASALADNGVRCLAQMQQEEKIEELLRRVAIMVIET